MLLQLLIYAVPAILVAVLLQNYFFLRSIPGPFLAKFTDLYRLLLVLGRKPHEKHLELHKRYGNVVRLGPKCVSVTGSAGYIGQIYGIGKGLVKSDFYSCFQNIVNGRRAASLVAMTDESEHAKSKRQIAHAYSLSTLVEYEELVDRTTDVFLATLEERFAANRKSESQLAQRGQGQVLDLGRYLQFFAFDVIGELTFSRRLGFIESGTDVNDIIDAIGANFNYFSVLGQMPWLDEAFLGKNPIYVKWFRKSVSSPILLFAQSLLKERLRDIERGEKESDRALDRPDFLSRFLKVRKEEADPESALTDAQILSHLFMNINAGSDTIASTLRAIFYHLLKHPSTLSQLVNELDTAVSEGKIAHPPSPTWSETQQHLPYLCAVVKEGLRMNPALSLPLERVVPGETGNSNSYNKTGSGGGGLVLQHEDGSTPTILPPGTIVGINPWVFHRSPNVFGPDAEQWNPSRWLTEHEKQTKHMEHSLLAFGAGKRSCLGKNIAMLELHKLVPALLLQFNLELADPQKEWDVSNAWVLNQTGLDVRLTVR
ncbi:Cytochrome P450 monooxygenase [Exophiala dermatitidis]|uniref:Cytochrome P450 oxidoreductase n=1 Tax=Exophiala dermatitidis (strain ATCC 34100 / CBS 525.76 / NIH/UT8656) TaxID=858893 RepID=H6BNU9_EXODN|nr:cytochrome P450 oxidoreductase [Exophiala dermatitidis NIH/UT8656]EHY52284.1 cytochrome P450 oxidoreductase [Exophiala dermatitidis NIH/UT8656]